MCIQYFGPPSFLLILDSIEALPRQHFLFRSRGTIRRQTNRIGFTHSILDVIVLRLAVLTKLHRSHVHAQNLVIQLAPQHSDLILLILRSLPILGRVGHIFDLFKFAIDSLYVPPLVVVVEPILFRF